VLNKKLQHTFPSSLHSSLTFPWRKLTKYLGNPWALLAKSNLKLRESMRSMLSMCLSKSSTVRHTKRLLLIRLSLKALSGITCMAEKHIGKLMVISRL
jgi:hypothetical protein